MLTPFRYRETEHRTDILYRSLLRSSRVAGASFCCHREPYYVLSKLSEFHGADSMLQDLKQMRLARETEQEALEFFVFTMEIIQHGGKSCKRDGLYNIRGGH